MLEHLSGYMLFYGSLIGAVCLLPSLIREIRQHKVWHFLVALCCAPLFALLATTIVSFTLIVVGYSEEQILELVGDWLFYWWMTLAISAFLSYCLGRYVLKNRLGGLPFKVTMMFVLYLCLETSYPLFIRNMSFIFSWFCG